MQHLKRVSLRNLPGTTLIELCTVMVLLGFIALLSMRFYVRNDTVAHLELNHVYAALVYVRRKAILEGRVHHVSFTQRSYILDEEIPLARSILFAVPPHAIKGPPGNPIDLLKKAITYKNGILEASPDGTLSAGSLYITDDAHSCLYALTTDASAVTGIRRYRYIDSSAKWEPLD